MIAGTIFEKTRIAQVKRGVSATYLSDELGIAYQTAWTIQHKVRKAMGERDAAYTLAGIVELDDAFFGAQTEGGKRGRCTEQTTVFVAFSVYLGAC